MRIGTAIMLTAFASLGASLWRAHSRIRALEVKAPKDSEFDGLVLPLLFSTHAQVAHC
jgi:hypothetical protein